ASMTDDGEYRTLFPDGQETLPCSDPDAPAARMPLHVGVAPQSSSMPVVWRLRGLRVRQAPRGAGHDRVEVREQPTGIVHKPDMERLVLVPHPRGGGRAGEPPPEQRGRRGYRVGKDLVLTAYPPPRRIEQQCLGPLDLNGAADTRLVGRV